MTLFSKLKNIFWGYFDPLTIIYTKKVNIFQGELTYVSVKTRTLEKGDVYGN